MDALEDLTILDLTSHIAGPYATKLLADLGARVIKVERPGGDPARRLGPFAGDEPGPERSGTFHFLNTNKESVVLDLKRDRARDVLSRLVERADLVVEAFPPAVAERLGTDSASLRSTRDVPVVSITNFGQSGPYRDYQLSETVLFAMGGEMYATGLASGEPMKTGGTSTLLQSGAMAAVAALGAIHAWEFQGVAQHVDVPLFETQIQSVDRRSSAILAYRFSGRILERAATPQAAPAGGVYPCADGYVEVTASLGNYWNRFVEMIGDESLTQAPFDNPATAASPDGRAAADAIVYPWMLTRTRREIWEAARKAHAMVAPLFTGTDLVDDPVFRERGFWEQAEHEVLGTITLPGAPYRLEKTPWRLRSPAPTLGQHTDAILCEVGYSEAEVADLRKREVVA
ncbi:MAG: CoA transferase [Dehalococcoidia bacterium]|nr:CoA transferase [Dehalococcoidia bacterium]